MDFNGIGMAGLIPQQTPVFQPPIIEPNINTNPNVFTQGNNQVLESTPATSDTNGWIQKLFGNGKVFGMDANKFASMAGQAAAAIGGSKTMGGRLGAMAAQMAAAQMQAIAAKNQLSAYTKVAQDFLTSTPNQTRLGNIAGGMGLNGAPTLQDMYQTSGDNKSVRV